MHSPLYDVCQRVNQVSDGDKIGGKYMVEVNLGLQNNWLIADTVGWRCTTGINPFSAGKVFMRGVRFYTSDSDV